MSPTISEIQVESRIIWLWTLGNFETWIEVGLYGHHLLLLKNEDIVLQCKLRYDKTNKYLIFVRLRVLYCKQ
jgi:hypothetical protein